MKDQAISLSDYKAQSCPEYTVSELSGLIKRNIEETVGFVRVRGEISGFKIAPSGHIYFSLKDNNAVLSAVCWKGLANSLKHPPEDGLDVVCTGSITIYAGQSKYQMIVQNINPVGLGALMALLEKRKQQFITEGLFNPEHKKKLPFLPKIIGVVTSPTGAVINDILHRIKDRFPSRVIIWPVLVQGEESAQQVARAIYGFNSLDKDVGVPRPDVLIIARGGGSIEDLWGFNEEIVVRAVFNSQIPIISAIGHETDTTLIDYVADVRAPTPTAAAEFAVPVKRELACIVHDLEQRQLYAFERYMDNNNAQVASLQYGLPNLQSVINNYAQKLDDFSLRLIDAFPRYSANILNKLQLLAAKIEAPNYFLNINKNKLTSLFSQISNALKGRLLSENHRLEMAAKLLESYDYKNTLKRGFAVIRDAEKNIISSIAHAKPTQAISVELADGTKLAKFE